MAIMVVWCFLGTGHYELAWERVIFEEGLIIFFLSDLYLSVPFIYLKDYQSWCEIVGLRVWLYKIVHVHRKFVETGEKLYQCLLSRVLKSDFQYCNVSYWWFQPEFSHVSHKTYDYENTYERKTIPVHWI